MDELPTVLKLHVLQFLDHSALHAAEQTSHALLILSRKHELWKRLADATVVYSDLLSDANVWKQLVCLAQCTATDNTHLIGGVKAFSSADRPSESPLNTLTSSHCWMELYELQLRNLEEETELARLGERIQHRCGCSSSESCYWSSSASTNENAIEYIDYALNGPCVIKAVQIVPYRVFWHPDSPTYAPKRVQFEFYDVTEIPQQEALRWRDHSLDMSASVIKPFYSTHEYEVQNEMTLQEFVLPRNVATSRHTVMRVTLVGRHQAQTFVLVNDDEDTQPIYYCCLSYVNVRGVPWKPVQANKKACTAMTHPYSISPNLQMVAFTGLAVYMTACYKGCIGRT
ncbi:F-box domain [Plasmopara halstedii]|uniref:F-box domain n=1 Tax=Plasmopara halstedii TaxID=4781 RepID=A0A0P1B8T6_PLAHL|nr:F-box domain [Plasmopara halstedii]CEG50260.1 F-box domain [Plasmopara halstedii]|eukprot:XP_024586629.1 F-box domain [Plasmopara halstedii]